MRINKLFSLVVLGFALLLTTGKTYGQLAKTLCDNLATISEHTFVIGYEKEGKEYIMYDDNGTELNGESALKTRARAVFQNITVQNSAKRYFTVEFENGEYLSKNGYGKISAEEYKKAFEKKKNDAGMYEYVQPHEKRKQFLVELKVNDDGTVNLGENTTKAKLYLVKI